MNLEEGLLEDILGGGPITRQANEEAEEVVLMPLDKASEGSGIAASIGLQELLVGALGHGQGFGGGDG